MRVLFVKLSSLGDVVHAYPALTDAAAALPGVEIDWLVDETFAPLARLHPAIRRVIPLPIRRLRKRPAATWAEARARIGDLRSEPYDILIDAQGLVKSAIAGRFARATKRHGFGRGSAREGLAALTYDVGHDIPETEHMATRIRRLLAAALGYTMPGTPSDPGLVRDFSGGDDVHAKQAPYVVLIHGTSSEAKTWTIEGWRELAARLAERGLDAVLFAHGRAEEERVARIAEGLPNVRTLLSGPIGEVIPIISGASGAVSVDTGLGHLAAAYGLPTVGLYGPTDPALTGLVGAHVAELVPEGAFEAGAPDRGNLRRDRREGSSRMASHRPEVVARVLLEMIPES